MARASYDAIVLGAGGVGSAAMWQLASRGLKVLGIDRFAPPHARGSSHGQTRIIRQAYFEHPDYVPLLLESYRLWRELEGMAGRPLLVETGLLEVGSASGAVVPGVLDAARQHGLEVQTLAAAEIEHRWPALRIPDPYVGVFEARAGFLHVEPCVEAQLTAARRAGAELKTEVEVHEWCARGEIHLRTSAGDFSADRLVITAGAWAGTMLAGVLPPLEVRRKVMLWHRSDDQRLAPAAGFPCFLFEQPDSVVYGFPAIDPRGLKLAEHSGGGSVADPLSVDRSLHADDQAPIADFVHRHFPSVSPACCDHAVCLYTMSPDEHFIVDRHPQDERIVFAAGLSGHGFKFAPVLGALLADLALSGTPRLPIGFLGVGRFSAGQPSRAAPNH